MTRFRKYALRVAVLILVTAATAGAVIYSYRVRGYFAVGGEWLIPGVVVAMWAAAREAARILRITGRDQKGVSGKMKILYIKQDGSVNEEEIPNTLEALQAKVGGYIEVVRISKRLRLVIHEEGKLRGLSLNRKATKLYQTAWGAIDIIVGNAVVTAIDPGGEDFESLTPDDIRAAKNAM